ncbi:SCP2 sterol-binding domain-containing protein [Parasphingorhabdus pacifica]
MAESDSIDALGDIDPKKITPAEFAALLDDAANTPDLGLYSLTPEQFSRLISRASSEQIDSVMASPRLRETILDEVFRRMGEHYKSDQARNTEAVVRWRIGTGDEHLRYECVLSGGTCTVNKEPENEPRVTITLAPGEFLKLASGNASAPVLFMTGKIKVAGDVGFAAGLAKLFQIPKA